MRMEDDKHKPLKYTIYAKSGYTAPKPWTTFPIALLNKVKNSILPLLSFLQSV